MKTNLLLSYILSFLASIVLFLLIVVGSVYSYTQNPNAVLKELENQNYYERLASEIEKEMKLDIISSGLPSSVLENLYTKEMIQEEITNSLTATYAGKNYEINTSLVEENLKKNIEEYLSSNNIVITDQESLDTFVSDVTGLYKSGINLYDYSKYIKEIIKKIKTPITWIFLGLLILEVILICIIAKFMKEKYYGAIALTTTALLILSQIYVTSHIDIAHLFLFTEFFSDTMKAIIYTIFNLFMWVEGLLFIVFFLIEIIKVKRNAVVMSNFDERK